MPQARSPQCPHVPFFTFSAVVFQLPFWVMFQGNTHKARVSLVENGRCSLVSCWFLFHFPASAAFDATTPRKLSVVRRRRQSRQLQTNLTYKAFAHVICSSMSSANEPILGHCQYAFRAGKSTADPSTASGHCQTLLNRSQPAISAVPRLGNAFDKLGQPKCFSFSASAFRLTS